MATEAAILRGKGTQSTAADNATATASVAAIAEQRHTVYGVHADYSAAVAAIKTVTVKHGSTTWAVFRWDFTAGMFIYNFPLPFRGALNEAVSVELEASGTGGTTGRCTIFTATD